MITIKKQLLKKVHMNKKIMIFLMLMIIGNFNIIIASYHRLNQETQNSIKNIDISSMVRDEMKQRDQRIDNSTCCRIAQCRINPTTDNNTNASCISIKCDTCANRTQSVVNVACYIPQLVGVCLCSPCIPAYVAWHLNVQQDTYNKVKYDLLHRRVSELEKIHMPTSSIISPNQKLPTISEED